MPGVEIQPSSADRAAFRQHVISIVQGSLSAFGEGFALSTIVVAAYVSLLADRVFVVGLVPLVAFGLANLGSVAGSALLRFRLRARWIAVLAGAARATAMSGMAYFAFQESTGPQDRLRQILITYALYAFATGITSASTTSLIRLSVGVANRSSVFAARSVVGALLTALSGAVLYQLFSQEDVITDKAFAYAFVAAAAAMAAAAFFTLTLRPRRQTAEAQLQRNRNRSPLRQSTFQRFLMFRIVLGLAGMANIFLIVYAIDELQVSQSYLGILVALTGLTLAVSGLVLRRTAPTVGGRSVLQISSMLSIVPPLLALTTIYVAESNFYTERRSDTLPFEILFAIAFVFWSLAATTVNAGTFRYLADSKLSLETPASAWTNVLLGIISGSALVGGLILHQWSYQALFTTAAGCGLGAILASGLLGNPRRSPRPQAATPARFGIGYSRSTLLGR